MVHRSTRRSLLALTAIVALALGVAACSSDNAADPTDSPNSSSASVGAETSGGQDTTSGSGKPAAADGSHTWGVSIPLAGPLASSGEWVQTGVESLVGAVNAGGGLDGHQVETKTQDNGADASKTAVTTTQLATSDQVSAIFNGPTSAVCSSAQPIAERYSIPVLCYAVAEVKDNIFTYGPQHERMGGVSLQAARKVVGDTSEPMKMALVYLNTATTIEWADSVEAASAAANASVVFRDKVDFATTDLSSYAAKIIAAKPDIVMWDGVPVVLNGFVKALRAGGLDVPVMSIDGASALGAVAATNDKNVYFMQPFAALDPATATGAGKDYVEAVTAHTGKSDYEYLNTPVRVAAYIGALATSEAATKCGFPCTGKDLQEKLNTMKFDFQGLAPGFSWANRDDKYPYSTFFLYQAHPDAAGADELGTFQLED